jgi:hypothetical protein
MANTSLSRGVHAVPRAGRPDLCYLQTMTLKETTVKRSKAVGLVVGSVHFRKLGAVEGIRYSSNMKGDVAI